MIIAIIGKPGVGKSTIFNAITGAHGLHGKRERMGIVNVPDKRVDELHKFYPSAKKVYATIEFIDTDKMDFSVEDIRNADGYLCVIGAYTENVDIKRNIQEIIDDMVIKDLEVVEKKLKKLKKIHNRESETEKKELEKVNKELDNGIPIKKSKEIDMDKLKGYSFVSAKPIFFVVNVKEGKKYQSIESDYPVLFDPGKTELEIAELPEEERSDFYKELGVGEPITGKIIREIYNELGLISFFTMGHREVRAWSISKGTTAKQAAGLIHSDLERGFIRAEVISYEQLINVGSEKGAKERGLIRLESKDYIVNDGDVLLIRFSV